MNITSFKSSSVGATTIQKQSFSSFLFFFFFPGFRFGFAQPTAHSSIAYSIAAAQHHQHRAHGILIILYSVSIYKITFRFPEIRIQYKYTVRCVTTAVVCTQFRSRSCVYNVLCTLRTSILPSFEVKRRGTHKVIQQQLYTFR